MGIHKWCQNFHTTILVITSTRQNFKKLQKDNQKIYKKNCDTFMKFIWNIPKTFEVIMLRSCKSKCRYYHLQLWIFLICCWCPFSWYLHSHVSQTSNDAVPYFQFDEANAHSSLLLQANRDLFWALHFISLIRQPTKQTNSPF